MLSCHQRITWRRNIAENFNRLSRVHERYRQTTDRWQTDDRRQTDGRTTTYSEHEHEFTFANKTETKQFHWNKHCFAFVLFQFCFSFILVITTALVLFTNKKSRTGFRLVQFVEQFANKSAAGQISSYGQFRRYLKNHLFGILKITAQCDAWFSALYKYSYSLTKISG